MKYRFTVILLLLIPVSVSAEFFVEAYGGRANTYSGSFSAYENRETEIPGGNLTSQGDLDGAKSSARGLRGGYWLDGNFRWFGVAAEGNYFQADSQTSDAEVSFTGFALMLMCRYPLMISTEYPAGRFYPYAAIGGMRASVQIESSYNNQAQGTVDSDFGGVFCMGIKLMVTPSFGVFAEYRTVSISFDEHSVNTSYDLFGWPHTRVFDAEGDAKAHQFIGGVSFHF